MWCVGELSGVVWIDCCCCCGLVDGLMVYEGWLMVDGGWLGDCMEMNGIVWCDGCCCDG